MTITGCGKYSGTIKKTYTISRIKLAANMLGSKVVRTEQSRGGAAPDVFPLAAYASDASFGRRDRERIVAASQDMENQQAAGVRCNGTWASETEWRAQK